MVDRLPPQVPRTLKHYRLLSRLGAGGMGAVFVAEDKRDRSKVAVKLLHPHLADDESFRERFEREAHVAALLRSPYTVHLLDYGRAEGHLFLVMELIEGRALSNIIEDGRVEPMRALRLATEVARALEEAEARGVVHRDIKPENILIADGDEVKVADFGIARRVGGSGATEAGGFVGSVLYASPEQARGEADRRSDVYALGAVLYAMLAGHPPFEGAPLEVLRKHSSESLPVAPLGGLPDVVVNIIRRCMEKDPQDRYQSASEMAGALERAQRFLKTWEQMPPASAATVEAAMDAETVDEASGTAIAPPPPVARDEPAAETVVPEVVASNLPPTPEAATVVGPPPEAPPAAPPMEALETEVSSSTDSGHASPEPATVVASADPVHPQQFATLAAVPEEATGSAGQSDGADIRISASLQSPGSAPGADPSGFVLNLTNSSRVPVDVALRSLDSNDCAVAMPAHVAVAAGTTAVPIRVTSSRRRWRGEDIQRPIVLEVLPAGGEPIKVAGEFRDRPRGPLALAGVIGGGIAALVLGAVGVALAFGGGGDGGDTDPTPGSASDDVSGAALVAALSDELPDAFASIATASVREVEPSDGATAEGAVGSVRLTLRRTGSGEAVDFVVFGTEAEARSFADDVVSAADADGLEDCATGDRLPEAAVTGSTTTCYGRAGSVVVVSSMRLADGVPSREPEAQLALQRGLQVADAVRQGSAPPDATRVPAASVTASPSATVPTSTPPPTPTSAPAVNSIVAGSWSYDFQVISNDCPFGPPPGQRFTLEFLLEEVTPDDGLISEGELVDVTQAGSGFYVGRLTFTFPDFSWIYPISAGDISGLGELSNSFFDANSGTSSLTELYDLGDLQVCELASTE